MSTFLNLKPLMHPFNRAVNRDQAIDVFHAPHRFTSVPGNFVFTVAGVTDAPAVGQTYTNNSSTFTIVSVNVTDGVGTITAARTAGTNNPQASGDLTESGTLGAGQTTIAFSAVTGGPVAANAFSDTIPSGAMALVEFYGVGKGTDGSRIGFRVLATVENNAGTMALVGTPSQTIMEDNTSANQTDANVTVSGDKFHLTVDRVDNVETKWVFGYNKLVF